MPRMAASATYSHFLLLGVLFTHISKHKEAFAIINSVGKQAHLVRLTRKYSRHPAQRNGHMDNRLVQTPAKRLQKYNAMVQLSQTWHSAWEQVGFHSLK